MTASTPSQAQDSASTTGAAPRARASVATHYVRYIIGNVLIMIAGFVSFPIMTRLLDTGQYGIFGYFDAWLLILVAICKLGGQHTILRFFPHVGGTAALARYGASVVLAPFAAACALVALLLAAYAGIVHSRRRKPRTSAGSCC